MIRPRRWRIARRTAALLAVLVVTTACSGSNQDTNRSGSPDSTGSADIGAAQAATSFIADVRAAVKAVEAVRGGPQEFFEVTATPQLVNVFVAVDGATSAVPYVYLAGGLEEPGPTVVGVAGQVFLASAIDFDEAEVLSGVQAELPTSTIDAFSVEGGPGGFVRYVVSVRSEQGGVLDVVVAPNGTVIEFSRP